MDKIKKQALEAAGWKFGDAEDFLNEGRAMNAEKMRAEFEKWAKAEGFILAKWVKIKEDGQHELGEYADADTRAAEKGYQAGRKAEREWMQLKNWDGIRLGTTKLEGDNERG